MNACFTSGGKTAILMRLVFNGAKFPLKLTSNRFARRLCTVYSSERSTQFMTSHRECKTALDQSLDGHSRGNV
jgi:hypothetical protein